MLADLKQSEDWTLFTVKPRALLLHSPPLGQCLGPEVLMCWTHYVAALVLTDNKSLISIWWKGNNFSHCFHCLGDWSPLPGRGVGGSEALELRGLQEENEGES